MILTTGVARTRKGAKMRDSCELFLGPSTPLSFCRFTIGLLRLLETKEDGITQSESSTTSAVKSSGRRGVFIWLIVLLRNGSQLFSPDTRQNATKICTFH
jgi:hypothetical protein